VKYLATVGGDDYSVDVQPGAQPGAFLVTLNGLEHEVDVQSSAHGWLFSLLVDGHSIQVSIGEGELQVEGQRYAVDVQRDLGLDRRSSRATATGPAKLKAPIPGLVVAVQAQPGDEVQEGQALVIVEAMKMQMELKSPRAGKVLELTVQPGQEVNQGQVLAVIGE